MSCDSHHRTIKYSTKECFSQVSKRLDKYFSGYGQPYPTIPNNFIQRHSSLSNDKFSCEPTKILAHTSGKLIMGDVGIITGQHIIVRLITTILFVNEILNNGTLHSHVKILKAPRDGLCLLHFIGPSSNVLSRDTEALSTYTTELGGRDDFFVTTNWLIWKMLAFASLCMCVCMLLNLIHSISFTRPALHLCPLRKPMSKINESWISALLTMQ